MPYEVRGKCVYKKDTGKKVGCTKGDVKKYLAALHANTNEGKKMNSITKTELMKIVKEEIESTLEEEVSPVARAGTLNNLMAMISELEERVTALENTARTN
jgi:polyhydroxyalkanoate synthesis regulator phasin